MSIEAEVAYETMKINKYIESLKKNRKARKDDKQMKYEFRVGDYVETKDGQIGYISTFTHSFDGRNIIFVDYRDGRAQGYKFYENELLRFFNRIGQYDFTKNNKIKPLLINKYISIYCGNGKTNSPSDYKTVFEQDELNDKMINKINELVEAVNRLEEKVNEMA